ncbi:MAG: hypothetical protein J6T96_13475, partial [Bacteroidales bacterium]|nr:hypothetical protein [Bacteroidales bacterium]
IIIKDGELHRMRYELKDFTGNVRKVNFTVKGVKDGDYEPVIRRGTRVSWEHDNVLCSLKVVIDIPAGNFYKDEYLEIAREDSNVFKRPLYTIGSKEIPVHGNIGLTIPVPDDLKQKLADSSLKPRQVFIARTGKKNSLGYVGGTFNGENITAKPRYLGNFLIAVDTIPPRVVTKNSATLLSQSNNVMVGISDNFSGIEKYNVYIDGEWKIFEYDYKNSRLISQVKKLGLKSGAHTLVAKIEDACGNLTEWEWKFRVR